MFCLALHYTLRIIDNINNAKRDNKMINTKEWYIDAINEMKAESRDYGVDNSNDIEDLIIEASENGIVISK